MRIHPIFRLALLLAALLDTTPATSQTWPSRPVTMIVPYAAGGSVDVVARVVASKLGERLGQTIVIENVAGAGGVTGTQRAARAEPDGYTLLFSVESTMAIAKLVQPTVVKYDSLKDFLAISLIGDAPLVLAGKKELPASNIAELMTLLRQNPGKYNFASSGVGTSLQLAGEMINIEGKVKMVHVPYRVGAQMVTDLMGNQIDLAVLPLVMALPNYRAGNIKIFGITEDSQIIGCLFNRRSRDTSHTLAAGVSPKRLPSSPVQARALQWSTRVCNFERLSKCKPLRRPPILVVSALTRGRATKVPRPCSRRTIACEDNSDKARRTVTRLTPARRAIWVSVGNLSPSRSLAVSAGLFTSTPTTTTPVSFSSE